MHLLYAIFTLACFATISEALTRPFLDSYNALPPAYYTFPLRSDINQGIYYEAGWQYMTITTSIGIYPQSPPNLALVSRPYAANITTVPFYSTLQSAYVACTCATYQPWVPVPIAIPVGCKIKIQAYEKDGEAIPGASNEFVFTPDAVKVPALTDLAVISFPEVLRQVPLPSKMMPIKMNLPPAMRYQFSASIQTAPFVVPKGLPLNLTTALQDQLRRADSSSFGFVLDDLRYTRLEP